MATAHEKLVEAVARAMAEQFGGSFDDTKISERDNWRKRARAALAVAMKAAIEVAEGVAADANEASKRAATGSPATYAENNKFHAASRIADALRALAPPETK